MTDRSAVSAAAEIPELHTADLGSDVDGGASATTSEDTTVSHSEVGGARPSHSAIYTSSGRHTGWSRFHSVSSPTAAGFLHLLPLGVLILLLVFQKVRWSAQGYARSVDCCTKRTREQTSLCNWVHSACRSEAIHTVPLAKRLCGPCGTSCGGGSMPPWNIGE